MKKFTLLLFALVAVVNVAKADVEWTIWEGSMNASSSGTAGKWDSSLYLKSNNFANLSVGDVIYFTLTKNDNASGQAHVVLYYQNTLVKDATTTYPETELTSIDTDGNCSYTITSDNLKYFQGYYDGECTSVEFINLVIKGYDFTLTKVSIKKYFSAIKKTLSNSAVQFGDWANQYEVAASQLSNVQAGDFFYVPATKQTTKADESAVTWWQAQFYYNWNNLYNVNSVDHDIWAEIQETDISNITSNVFHLKGQYYNCTGVYLYHPISSFSIGQIGYATFSANQQVTAPNTVTAYKGTISGSNLVLTPFTNNVIPANTGAIIKGEQGAVLEFTASSAETSETSDLFANTAATSVSSLAEEGYDLYVLYPGTAESETNLSLSTLVGAWGAWHPTEVSWNSSTYTITYSGIASGEGGWVEKDWSDYDYLQLNFSSNTLNADATFYVAYNEHDGNTTEATLSQGSTSVRIPLDATYKNCNGNFSMWSNATSGSLTFESAALIDNDGATIAEFRKTTSGTLAANKAYLKIPTGEGARALSIVFDDEQETTAIESVAPKAIPTDNVYYNLRGQRVAQPTKGLYIVNGKKVVIK